VCNLLLRARTFPVVVGLTLPQLRGEFSCLPWAGSTPACRQVDRSRCRARWTPFASRPWSDGHRESVCDDPAFALVLALRPRVSWVNEPMLMAREIKYESFPVTAHCVADVLWARCLLLIGPQPDVGQTQPGRWVRPYCKIPLALISMSQAGGGDWASMRRATGLPPFGIVLWLTVSRPFEMLLITAVLAGGRRSFTPCAANDLGLGRIFHATLSSSKLMGYQRCFLPGDSVQPCSCSFFEIPADRFLTLLLLPWGWLCAGQGRGAAFSVLLNLFWPRRCFLIAVGTPLWRGPGTLNMCDLAVKIR